MMSKRNYFLFYILFVAMALNAQSDDFIAQNRNLTSLSEELNPTDLLEYLETHPYSEEKLQRQSLLMQAKCQIQLKNPTRANQITTKIIAVLNNPQDSISIYQLARAYELKGHIQYKLKRLDSAYFYIDFSSDYYLKNRDFAAAVYNYNMISTMFFLSKNFKDALRTAFKALEIYEENYSFIDSSYYVDLMVDIGNIYMNVEDYEKSISLYLKLFDQVHQMTENQHGDAHNNLGYSYYKTKQRELSRTQFERAESLYLKTNNLKSLGRVYNNLALLYDLEYNNIGKGEDYYKKSIAIKKQLNETSGLTTTYINLAVLMSEHGNSDSALAYGIKAKNLSLADNNKIGLFEAYDLIAKIYHQKGAEDSAYFYLRLHSELARELEAIEEKAATATIVELRNVLLQQKEIELLEKEKEVTALKLARHKTLLILLGSSLIFLLVVFYMYMKFFRHKQKVAEDIHKRNIALTSVTSLVKGQEAERNRIARDLHDGVGNSLTLLNHKAMTSKLPEIQELTNQISREVRDISHNIMPGILLKLGLKEALLDMAESWKNTDVILDISYNLDNDIFEEKDQQLTLFRALQEIVKNAIENGKSAYISMLFAKDNNEVIITIEDNGIGFDINATNKGLGLNNIQTRIDFLKGNLDFISTPKGSTVIITLPKL